MICSKVPLRQAPNLCGPFLCNRASCCVPEAPLKGPLHMISNTGMHLPLDSRLTPA